VTANLATEAVQIPVWADVLAISIGSAQGAAFTANCRERRIDILGVCILGTIAGLGGSVLRDVQLGVVPVMLTNNAYLIAALVAALIGMLAQRLFARVDTAILVLDAVSVGLYVAIGVTKALWLGFPPVPSVFVGVAAGVGGSALRDVILGSRVVLLEVGTLYAVAALAGALGLLAALAAGLPAALAALVCVLTTTVTRVLALVFGWTLPEQRPLTRAALPPIRVRRR